MRKQKLKKLFEAARNEMPPVPPDNFESRVMSEIHREPAIRSVSLFDQLNFLFPRIALAAVVIMVACTVFEVVADGPDLTDSAAQLSDQGFSVINDL